jgi:hypothetical protein
MNMILNSILMQHTHTSFTPNQTPEMYDGIDSVYTCAIADNIVNQNRYADEVNGFSSAAERRKCE